MRFRATHAFTNLNASQAIITASGVGNAAGIGADYTGAAAWTFRIAVAGKGVWLKRFKGAAVAAQRGTNGEEYVPAGPTPTFLTLDPQNYDGFAIIDDNVGVEACRGSVSIIP